MKSNVKAQFHLEFMLAVSLSMVILLVFLIAIRGSLEEKIEQKHYLVIRDYGLSLQKEFITAAQVHNGYMRHLTIPDSVSNVEFGINNTENYLYIYYDNENSYYKKSMSFKIPVVNGSLKQGFNESNIIKKQNNTIYILN
ncbi:hypothetical protein JW949_02515 [Candidatus Woesearchaeota archaeon]|nr:hypothetical protein [Candidatus Woesearchaeota archaeon]